MKKVAVILSGCGVYDGAEIHEAVLTLLALELGFLNHTLTVHLFIFLLLLVHTV